MPSKVDAAGRRKVRCPKCTAGLTEPEAGIYECPVCLTLLLGKHKTDYATYFLLFTFAGHFCVSCFWFACNAKKP